MTAGVSRAKPHDGLTERQERFAQNYAHSLSVSEAAKAAGTSRRYGYQILELQHVKDRIKKIQREELGEKVEVDQMRVMRETAYLAFSDVTEVLGSEHNADDLRALPARVRKAIKKIKTRRYEPKGGDPYTETEIEMHAKTEPLKLLALCTGATTDPRLDPDAKARLPFTGFDVIIAPKQPPQQIEAGSSDADDSGPDDA